VVHGHERHVPHQRQGLCGAHADQQRPGQTGAGGGGHGIEVCALGAGGDECLCDDRHHLLDMGPAGDLGHHPAERGMPLHLTAHHRRAHELRPFDDRSGRLVAGGLDPQDHIAHAMAPACSAAGAAARGGPAFALCH
jgi:hypothetical protein